MAEFKNGDLAFSKVEVREKNARKRKQNRKKEAPQEKKLVVEAVKPEEEKRSTGASLLL